MRWGRKGGEGRGEGGKGRGGKGRGGKGLIYGKREGEREREGDRKIEKREVERWRESVCVCV